MNAFEELQIMVLRYPKDLKNGNIELLVSNFVQIEGGDVSFDYTRSRPNKLWFKFTTTRGLRKSCHAISAFPCFTEPFFAINVSGGGNCDLTNKQQFQKDLVAHFSRCLQTEIQPHWQKWATPLPPPAPQEWQIPLILRKRGRSRIYPRELFNPAFTIQENAKAIGCSYQMAWLLAKRYKAKQAAKVQMADDPLDGIW